MSDLEGLDGCANCGAARGGAYCGVCGQRALPARLTLREGSRRLIAGATDLDRGLLHTAARLFRDPAGVVRDYGRGRTVPYANPLKYFVLALAALQAAALLTGAIGELASGMVEGDAAKSARLGETMDRYFVLFAAPAVIVLVLLQAGILGRGRRNLAESVVFALFVCGQQALVWAVAMPVLGLSNSALTVGALLAVMLGTAGYYGWAASGYFERGLGSTVWRSALVLALTMVLYTLILAVALTALGYL